MLQNDCNMICLKHSLNTWQKQAVSEKPQNKREEGGEGDDSGGENGPSVLTLWLTKMALQCWHSGSLKWPFSVDTLAH